MKQYTYPAFAFHQASCLVGQRNKSSQEYSTKQVADWLSEFVPYVYMREQNPNLFGVVHDACYTSLVMQVAGPTKNIEEDTVLFSHGKAINILDLGKLDIGDAIARLSLEMTLHIFECVDKDKWIYTRWKNKEWNKEE